MLTWRIRGGKALGAKQKSQRVSKTTFWNQNFKVTKFRLEKLKKIDVPGRLNKSTTGSKSLFVKDEIFAIQNLAKMSMVRFFIGSQRKTIQI